MERINYGIERDNSKGVEEVKITVSIVVPSSGVNYNLAEDEELVELAHYQLIEGIDRHSGYQMINTDYYENILEEEPEVIVEKEKEVIINEEQIPNEATVLALKAIAEVLEKVDNHLSERENKEKISLIAVELAKRKEESIEKPTVIKNEETDILNEVQKKYDILTDLSKYESSSRAQPVFNGLNCEIHKTTRKIWRNPVNWLHSNGEHNIWMAHNQRQRNSNGGDWCRYETYSEAEAKKLLYKIVKEEAIEYRK